MVNAEAKSSLPAEIVWFRYARDRKSKCHSHSLFTKIRRKCWLVSIDTNIDTHTRIKQLLLSLQAGSNADHHSSAIRQKDSKKILLTHSLHRIRVRWFSCQKANKMTLKQTFRSFFIKTCSFSADDSNVKACGLCSGSWVGCSLSCYVNNSSVFHLLGCELHSWALCRRDHRCCWATDEEGSEVWNFFSPTGAFHDATERAVVKALSPRVRLLK